MCPNKYKKMSMLSDKELKDYNDNGFVAPIDVLTLEEAEQIKKENPNTLKKKWPKELAGFGRNNVHYISPPSIKFVITLKF